jgi:aryl-alcohol dehydrogenase-like predicted oxidoreductase
MQKRKLGTSALEMSVVGLGGNNFGGRIDFAASERVVHAAIELGINMIDTADSYGNKGGSEEWLGRILGDRRREIVLATKFGLPMDDTGTLKGASRRYIMHAVVRQGKVRFIGCSNLSAQQVVEAQNTARQHGLAAFVSCQDEYSLLVRDIERELIPAAKAHGMGLLPYFPLASGLLTGKYRRGATLPEGSRLSKNPRHAEEFGTERNWRLVAELEALAARRGRTMLELAFGWLLRDATVTSVIAGATTPGQVAQNIHAAQCTLSAEDLAEIDRITL